MSRRPFRASGWSSALPRVVGERSVEDMVYDRRPARTSVWQRRVFRVPDGPPSPCSVCGAILTPGDRAARRIVGGEAFYRHLRCVARHRSVLG